MSATETREAEWSDADRLDVLGAQWQHVDRQASQQRYQQALRDVLPDEQAEQVMDDPAATWLWRSLREAEAAGLDGPATLRRLITARRLDDAESLAKVIDWRIRQHIAGMPAVAAQPWAEQVRPTGDADMDRYWRELAEAMTDRQRRLGEHAAEHPPVWAQALGSVPEHPVDRAEWEHKASLVAAYREMWGYTHPYEPIGPKPGQHSAEAAGSWQSAAEALGYTPGSDLREHSDGQLLAWRATFDREMTWAPAYKADDLATVRRAIHDAEIETDRANRNAAAADTDAARQRLEDLARLQAAWEQATRDLAARLTEAQAGYDAWEQATSSTRQRAIGADAELRRRHPDWPIEPLHVQAEPAPDAASEADRTGHDAAQPGQHADQSATKAERTADAGERQPATTDLTKHEARMAQIERQVREISARLDDAAMHQARQAGEKASEIMSMTGGAEDPDLAPEAAWIDELQARQREAVRHEPMPRIPATEAMKVAEPTVAAPEAAD